MSTTAIVLIGLVIFGLGMIGGKVADEAFSGSAGVFFGLALIFICFCIALGKYIV